MNLTGPDMAAAIAVSFVFHISAVPLCFMAAGHVFCTQTFMKQSVFLLVLNEPKTSVTEIQG